MATEDVNVALLGQLEGVANSIGWLRVIAFGLFALAFGYFLLKQPSAQ